MMWTYKWAPATSILAQAALAILVSPAAKQVRVAWVRDGHSRTMIRYELSIYSQLMPILTNRWLPIGEHESALVQTPRALRWLADAVMEGK